MYYSSTGKSRFKKAHFLKCFIKKDLCTELKTGCPKKMPNMQVNLQVEIFLKSRFYCTINMYVVLTYNTGDK